MVSWGFSHSIMRDKIGQTLFFIGEIAFFFRKFLFSITSWVLKRWSYSSHSNSQITSWNVISCSLTFVMSDIARKNRPKSFFHWKDCLFFLKFVFSTTSKVLKNWSYNFRSNCHFSFWTFINGLLRFFTLDYERQNRPKSFLHWKGCLSFQKFVFPATY